MRSSLRINPSLFNFSHNIKHSQFLFWNSFWIGANLIHHKLILVCPGNRFHNLSKWTSHPDLKPNSSMISTNDFLWIDFQDKGNISYLLWTQPYMTIHYTTCQAHQFWNKNSNKSQFKNKLYTPPQILFLNLNWCWWILKWKFWIESGRWYIGRNEFEWLWIKINGASNLIQ